MGERIAVLGAGGTGHAMAADLTLAGFEINLYEEPRFKENIEVILKRGGIEKKGAARQGFAKIHRVTTEIAEALKDVKLILVAVLASRHEKIAELCAPYLKDGQTIVISAGNAGSLVFAKKLKEMNVKSQVTIAETEGNLYPCRLTGPAEVVVALPYKAKYLAAFPAKDTAKVINALKGIYDCLPATNVLETALNSPNVVTHLAASILNTGAIEQSGGEYYLYKQGMTPSIFRCIEAVHEEKSALFKVLGWSDRYEAGFLEKVARQTEFPELEIFRGLIGPTSMQHRYITEDAPTAQALVLSLAEMVNVPTPVTRALVTLASTINRTDYLKQGRTVKRLGLSGLSVDELNRFLAEG